MMLETASGAGAPQAAEASKGAALRKVGLLGAALLFAIGLLALAMGPALYRAHVLDLDAATLGVAKVSLFAIAPAAVISAVVLVISLFARSTRGAIASILLLLASGLAGFRVYGFFVQRDWMPPLHEAQTDWSDPVAVSDGLARKRLLANAAPLTDTGAKIPAGHGRWSGMTPGEAQAGFFTDITPLREKVSVEAATKAAAEAAKTLDWRVERTDTVAGIMEASHRSAWYGLASDIVVRARAEGEGVRIDVRSISRTDGPDLGANASRVTQMKDAIAFQLRSAGKAPG